MRRARGVIYAATTIAWLAVCAWFWGRLVEGASDSPELYTRDRTFQLLNFIVQYLWFFVLAFAVVLALEWAVFRLLEQSLNGRHWRDR